MMESRLQKAVREAVSDSFSVMELPLTEETRETITDDLMRIVMQSGRGRFNPIYILEEVDRFLDAALGISAPLPKEVQVEAGAEEPKPVEVKSEPELTPTVIVFTILIEEIREAVQKVLQSHSFKPNDDELWKAIRIDCAVLLKELKKKYNLHRLSVECNEVTTPPTLRRNGIVRCEVTAQGNKKDPLAVFDVQLSPQISGMGR